MLDPQIVVELASILTLDDDAFVVGGQALNLWAERYASSAPELALFGPYTSKDLDYFGHREAAEKLATALSGKIYLPSIDDATPQSAKVTAVIGGKTIEVDFLVSVLGVRSPNLENLATQIVVPIRTAEGKGELLIPVMHPLHCLQSRVANVITLRRNDDTALRQLTAAPIVLREYISEMLGQGEKREAVRTLQALFEYLRSDVLGRQAHTVLDTDPVELFTYFGKDHRLDLRYRWFNIRSMRREMKKRRKAKGLSQPTP